VRDVRASFDRIADRYDETRAYPAGVIERIAAAVEGNIPMNGRVLDIGVGTGRLAAPMRACGFDVVGIDVSSMMLGKARGKGLDQLLLADAMALPFPDRSFPCSVSVHLTHLISDWLKVLSEVGRVTSERYASVATEREGCEVEEMQRTYEEACAELGHEVKHPGLRERDLARIIKPVKVVDVADSRETILKADAIDRYRTRTYSNIWEVPEHVHNHAMDRLEETYRPITTLERKERISLIVWDAESVREYAARASVGGRGD
jgi:SAM-dependent methyltransferase